MDTSSANSLGGYPLGASNDPRAPYNEEEPEKIEVEVTISVTYSKTLKIVVPEGYMENDLREAVEELRILPLDILRDRAADLQDPDEQFQAIRHGRTTSEINKEIEKCQGWHTDEFEVIPD